MSKSIHIFKSFEEQEMFFLKHFFRMSYSERLQALARLQKKNIKDFNKQADKKITIKKHFVDGY